MNVKTEDDIYFIQRLLWVIAVIAGFLVVLTQYPGWVFWAISLVIPNLIFSILVTICYNKIDRTISDIAMTVGFASFAYYGILIVFYGL